MTELKYDIPTCGFGSLESHNINTGGVQLGSTSWKNRLSMYCGNVKIPVSPDNSLRTTYFGVNVVVVDAKRWGLSSNSRYNIESFRYLPAALAIDSSPHVDAYFHILNYLDFLRETTGRVSPIDGDLLVALVGFDGVANAFWSGGGNNGYMLFGNGDGRTMKSLVGADVIAHELTHALVETVCDSGSGRGLVYEGESGAINESVSDCFATAYEYWLNQRYNLDADSSNDIIAVPDFIIGEDVVINIGGQRKLRDLSDPEACQQPSKYGVGEFWRDPTDLSFDYGGVHILSGVTNYFFYLMCIGIGNTKEPIELLARVLPRLHSRCTMAEFATIVREENTVVTAGKITDALVAVGL